MLNLRDVFPRGLRVSSFSMRERLVLIGKSTAELRAWIAELGEPAYRGNQLATWIYRKAADRFEVMTDLPAALRTRLNEIACISPNRIETVQRSHDGTLKCLLALQDEQVIECVLLPYEDRISVCLSTQVGCAMGCRFCATAQGGFTRNLTAGEIIDQLLHLQRLSEQRISHVVLMGMGEPLLNLENVLVAIRLIHEEVGISMRRITLSTVGIVPKIYALADQKLPLTLAISLHAPDDETRARMMPVSRKWKVADLLEAARYYFERTGRRVTFEYLLLRGVNDTPRHARMLAERLRDLPCLVNLIPFNYVPTPDNFQRPEPERVKAFRQVLEQAGIRVTQRVERGHEIDAACGQLRGKHLGKPLRFAMRPSPNAPL
ncbi:putative dual-specificity RNA methyltransferase RlmN [bacterium HR15]|nr:putative dual-specificity RNA methyltransferase RlmN [bacterium HR15]